MDSLLTRLQRALTGRYAVEHELGRGGMAVVSQPAEHRHFDRQGQSGALSAARYPLPCGHVASVE